MNNPDLTQRPPRSARVRLGGFVILPRMLDKARATSIDKNGEYHYNCPLDKRFLGFVGIDADKLMEQVKAGLGDGALLDWIMKNASTPKNEIEIAAWSEMAEKRTTGDVGSHEFFAELHKKCAPEREDIATWFDLLDVDDFVSYGGKP